MRASNAFEYILNPVNGLVVFMTVIGAVYGVIPLLFGLILSENLVFLQLSGITALSVIAIWIGSLVRVFDFRFEKDAPRFQWSPRGFIAFTWILFFVFLLITFLSAPSIPIISALMGADGSELSLQRGAFLKGREGVGIILLYMNTFLVSTIVPYSIVLLYERDSNKKHIAAALFLLFCVSFMQKALFLNLILPVLAFLAFKQRLRARVFVLFLMGSSALLVAVTALSLRGDEALEVFGDENYLSAQYIPSSPFDYFVWRSLAVPIFTAADTLVVHGEQFDGRPLLGATSSFISGIFGLERINIERYVFEYQFGSWNEIANSNAFFAVDAFVNFGWIGVFVFGIFVGQVFRWFRISQDVAFKSMWPIFAFALFSASLIGTLLSNGFAYLLFHAIFIRVQDYKLKK